MLLMSEQVLRKLIKEADKVYSSLGMRGLESWANSQNGVRDYSRQIYEIICEKNRRPLYKHFFNRF